MEYIPVVFRSAGNLPFGIPAGGAARRITYPIVSARTPRSPENEIIKQRYFPQFIEQIESRRRIIEILNPAQHERDGCERQITAPAGNNQWPVDSNSSISGMRGASFGTTTITTIRFANYPQWNF